MGGLSSDDCILFMEGCEKREGDPLPLVPVTANIYVEVKRGFLCPGHTSLSCRREPEESMGEIQQDPGG